LQEFNLVQQCLPIAPRIRLVLPVGKVQKYKQGKDGGE
jgi:hypothetical protein